MNSVSPSTPRLEVDLADVERNYIALSNALGDASIHYAVKCNSDRTLVQFLSHLGCKFEVASLNELELLISVDVPANEVLFSNPVKMSGHISGAHELGLTRFAFDSKVELDKLAVNAPGSSVYVRLGVQADRSVVPSEGKFGVSGRQAVELMLYARQLGLQPYGVAFHVGSQMLDPLAWEPAIEQSAAVMTELLDHDIQLQMLDIGGGFPAFYGERIPSIDTYGELINKVLEAQLPYEVNVVAEPGRGLVASAGTLVATVIGTAVRNGRNWLHLDVGAFNGFMEALETQNQFRFPMQDSRPQSPRALWNVTGPTCDSQDTILFDVPLAADLGVGDTLWIETAGAYTTGYASRFNGFDIPSTQYV